MLKIVSVMIAGVILGFFLRRFRAISYVSRTISLTIYLMLLLLGVSIGTNPEIIGNLSTLGLEALFLSLMGIFGSLVAGWSVERTFFKDGVVREEAGSGAGRRRGADDNAGDNAAGAAARPAVKKASRGKKWMNRLKKASDSLIVVGFFILGIILGVTGAVGADILGENAVMVVLYFLIFQVGISLGHDTALKNAFRTTRPRVLLVPAATIVGTLAMSALAGLILNKWSVANCMAVGSGFAYYSLSSVLIGEYTAANIGEQLAAELATIALLANIIREIVCLLFTPLFVRIFGKIGSICVSGATGVDVCLPVLLKNCGKEYMPVALVNGMITDFSVPFLVTLFAAL